MEVERGWWGEVRYGVEHATYRALLGVEGRGRPW